MKRMVMLAGAVAVLASAAAGAAGAAPGTDAKVATLQQEVAALKRQVARNGAAVPAAQAANPTAALTKRVAALEKKVTALQTRLTRAERLTAAAIVLDECLTAVTADAFAGTWTVIDQIAQATQARTYFGSQSFVNDFQSCSALQIRRQQGGIPNTSVFSALTTLIS